MKHRHKYNRSDKERRNKMEENNGMVSEIRSKQAQCQSKKARKW